MSANNSCNVAIQPLTVVVSSLISSNVESAARFAALLVCRCGIGSKSSEFTLLSVRKFKGMVKIVSNFKRSSFVPANFYARIKLDSSKHNIAEARII